VIYTTHTASLALSKQITLSPQDILFVSYPCSLPVFLEFNNDLDKWANNEFPVYEVSRPKLITKLLA
jgi:hypothetical protein